MLDVGGCGKGGGVPGPGTVSGEVSDGTAFAVHSTRQTTTAMVSFILVIERLLRLVASC